MNTHIPPRACKCASNVFNPKTPTSALAYFLLQFIKIKFQNFIYFLSTCTTILLYRYYAEAINFEISSNLLRLGLQEDSVYMCVYILTFTLLLSSSRLSWKIIRKHYQMLENSDLNECQTIYPERRGYVFLGFENKQKKNPPTCYVQ